VIRYFLHLAYRGTSFRGWQRQPQVKSVQAKLEECLAQVLRQPVSLIGCGRTDAEVHASDYYAHFDLEGSLPEAFLYKMNLTLPGSITIFKVFTVAGDWHARYAATRRTYDDHVHTEKDPFREHLSTYLFEDCSTLNREAMQQAAASLLNYTDFLAFCKVPEKHDSTICQLSTARFFFDEQPNSFRFQIAANRFLRGMVRLIVAQLLDVGRGRVSVAEFERLVAAKERSAYFVSAPPQGLYLSKVEYPFLADIIPL